MPGTVEDSVTIQWTPSAGTFDGYILELKIGTGSFQAQNGTQNLIPAGAYRLDVTLAATAPDMTDYTVRLRAIHAGAYSAYSNEAVYHRPLGIPLNLNGSFDWASMALRLTWDRHSTTATGYSLQRAESDIHGFAIGPWTSLPVPEPMASTYLDTQATPNAYFIYRIANTAGSTTSDQGRNWGPFLAGLTPPAPGWVYYDNLAATLSLEWTPATTEATGTLLERQTLDASGNPLSAWETMPLPQGVQAAFVDPSWKELTRYAYRVSNLRGTFASVAVPFPHSVATGLLPPTSLTAMSQNGGILLSWQNRSLAATQVGIYWSAQNNPTGFNLGSLLPSESSFLATDLPLGYYRFRVQAEVGQSAAATTSVDFTSPNPPDALNLTSSVLAMPDASHATLLPGGSWAFLSGPPDLKVLSSSNPWPAKSPGDALTGYIPAFLSDAQGHPHVIYVATNPLDIQHPALLHLWFDGSAWMTEKMMEGRIATGYRTNGFAATLDSAGMPHAIVGEENATGTYSCSYWRKVGAAWTAEPISIPDLNLGLNGVVAFGLDQLDNPHFVIDKTEYTRDAQGNWTSNLVAPIGSYNDNHWVEDAQWVDGNNAVVLFSGFGSTLDQWEAGVVEKVAGIWQPVRVLARDVRVYGEPSALYMGSSPDRTRVAILHNTLVGLRVYHRDGAGWHKTLLCPGENSYQWLRLGFDGANRIHVLKKPIAGTGYLEYKEP
ncbi:MAG: hypothetical protein IT187_06915 [Geothrix sp.]|nr:hypothetical protein [Geothrix sp.]